MKKKNSPIGVHFPQLEKTLLQERVKTLDVSTSGYIRDLVCKDLGLKEDTKVLELQEEIDNLKKENQRLLYEGNFKPQYQIVSESFQYKNVEVVNPMDIPVELKGVCLL